MDRFRTLPDKQPQQEGIEVHDHAPVRLRGGGPDVEDSTRHRIESLADTFVGQLEDTSMVHRLVLNLTEEEERIEEENEAQHSTAKASLPTTLAEAKVSKPTEEKAKKKKQTPTKEAGPAWHAQQRHNTDEACVAMSPFGKATIRHSQGIDGGGTSEGKDAAKH